MMLSGGSFRCKDVWKSRCIVPVLLLMLLAPIVHLLIYSDNYNTTPYTTYNEMFIVKHPQENPRDVEDRETSLAFEEDPHHPCNKLNDTEEGRFLLEPHLATIRTQTLLIYVLSSADNKARRQFIRDSWGNTSLYNTKSATKIVVMFVMGTRPVQKQGEPNNEKMCAAIYAESERFNDILYINMEDTMDKLTTKHLATISWIRENTNARQSLKVDENSFVNPWSWTHIREVVVERGVDCVIVGYINKDQEPERSGFYGVDVSSYPDDLYPNHVTGACYYMSRDAMDAILEASTYFKHDLGAAEDVYISGILGNQVEARLLGLLDHETATEHVTERFTKILSHIDDYPCVHPLSTHHMGILWRELQRQDDDEKFSPRFLKDYSQPEVELPQRWRMPDDAKLEHTCA